MTSTLRLPAASLHETAALLHQLGITVEGSRRGDDGYVLLIISGECVPDVPMVLATIVTSRTKEKNSISLLFEESEF